MTLRQVRDLNGYSQESLAKEACLSIRTVWRLENLNQGGYKAISRIKRILPDWDINTCFNQGD